MMSADYRSSTDLSPSILGMYDSLLGPKPSHSSSSLSGKPKNFQHQSPAVSQKKSQISVKMESVEKNGLVKSIPGGVKLPAMTEKPLLRQVLTPSKRENFEPAVEIIPKRAETTERTIDNSLEDQNNFTYLSPNVKRMLSSHSPVMQPKKASTLGSHGRSSTRHKQSNIPLIGATSKITQSSIEIYDTPKPREAVYDIPSPVRRVKPNTLPKALQELPLPVKFDSSMSGRRLKDMRISPSKSPYLNMMLAVKNVADCDDAAGEGSSIHSGGAPTGLSVPQIDITRPLSTSSIASSSSGSSCSGNRAKEGVNSAYMASIESLDDQSESDTFRRTKDRIERSETDCGSTIDEGPPRHLEMVCEEIVATEQVYVEDLRQVIEGYLYTWRETAAFDKNELHRVFSNVEDIYKVNRSFLERLDTCNFDPVKISKAFVDLNQHFSVYGDYCTAYPETIRALTNMMKDAASVQIFREQQAKMGHLLPLGSYLLKPVQRILKYHLLLQNLVKYCECEETLEALNIMTLMARHINDMKRKHEHAVRVQEIQSLLLGWSGPDLTTYGELCAEGTFRVFGFKAMRHAFLFDKMLLLTKHRDDGILAYKSHIMCNNLMLVESITGSPLSFHVIPWDSPRAQLTLQASSIVQKREWTLLLKRVILENYQAEIPSHARQLVMQLGQNKTDDDMIAEKSMTYSSMRKQLSAPEYLEKRKMERERRKKSGRKTTTATPAEFQAAIELCPECRDPAATQHCQPDRYTSNSTVDLNDDKYGGCVCSMDSDFGSSQESFSTNNTTDKMADSCENVQGSIEAKTCLKCLEITENIADSYSWRNHRCRHAQTLEPQKTRSKSKEDFHRSKLPKIGTWRRKSEPGLADVKAELFGEERGGQGGRLCARCDRILVCKSCGDRVINMYNSKHVPKKIYQIKKKRIAQGSTAKFYADFNEVLHISESTDSLNTISKDVESGKNEDLDYLNVIQIQKTDSFKKSELEKSKTVKNEEKPLEQIISQLLMENREFQQILKRHQQRNARRHQRLLKSHSDPEKILAGREAVKRQTSAVETSTADDHIYETLRVEEKKEDPRGDYVRVSVYESDYVYLHFDDLEKYGSGAVYDTPKRSDPWVKNDAPRKSVDYETDNTDHPEHRIYRTSPVKKQSKNKEKSTLPVYMQGSKSLGARIAHGDYMDPQTLLNRKGTSTESVNILINKTSLRSESIDDSIYERSVDKLEDLALETASPTLNRSNSVREKRRQIEQKILELNSAPKSIKLKNKTPPPIPAKPNFKNVAKSKFTDTSNPPPQSGWVKQVVNKFQ